MKSRRGSRGIIERGALLVATSALFLPACGSNDAASTVGGSDAGSQSDPAPDGRDSASGDAGETEPPPPPCDAAQTAALQASFDDGSIPAEIGAVGVIKDRSCGVRYFTRGASKDVPATSLHLIGSATKTYIASLTLLLVDDGKLALTDPVSKWIPNVPGGDDVKVEHLLRHTSGIYNYTWDFGYLLGMLLGLKTKYKPSDLLGIAFSKPTTFSAGAEGKWAYSNTNYVMLGMIIESITGKPVAEVLRERILGPIGASATFFNGFEPVVGEFAPGKAFNGSDGATFMDPSASWSCGNMAATVGDLAAWTEIRGSGKFHSPTMQTELTKGAPTGAPFDYGAALVMVDQASLNGNGPAIGHGGDNVGYHTVAYYFPTKKVTIAIVVDTDKGPTSGYPLGDTYVLPVYMKLVDPYFGTRPADP